MGYPQKNKTSTHAASPRIRLTFLAMVAANFILAYSHIPFAWKLWVGLLGVLFPFLALLAGKDLPFHLGKNPIPPTSPGPWAWVLVFCLALFTRFYRWETISTWPTPDDSIYATLAYHLGNGWEGNFFYGHSQVPFLYILGQAALFKAVGPSLSSMWIYPAFFSALLVPLVFFCARRYFQGGLAFALFLTVALDYWLLFTGRLNMATIWIPLGELAALFLFALALKASSRGGRHLPLYCMALGLAVAANSVIFTPAWPVMVFGFTAATAWLCVRSGRKSGIQAFLAYIAPNLLAPILILQGRDQYGTYLMTLLPFHDRGFLEQILTSLSYITGLFWGNIPGDYFGPLRGGFLNPVAGALFFMGLAGMIRHWRLPVHFGVLCALALSLLPGLLTNNLEFFRIFLIWPFLMVAVVGGWQLFTLAAPGTFRRGACWSLLAISCLWNTHHLFVVYQDHWKNPGPHWETYKSPELYRAYRILEDIQQRNGPGYVFHSMDSDMSDQGLAWASYPFNATLNPRLESASPKWFAIVTNVNYQPFLDKRFTGGQWEWLSEGLGRLNGGLAIGYFPLAPGLERTMAHWKDSSLLFQEAAFHFLNRPTGRSYDKVIQFLMKGTYRTGGDPFLVSCLQEKLYYLYLQESAFGNRLRRENFVLSKTCLEKALEGGYPAAHLLNEMGATLANQGDYRSAERFFQRALLSPLDRTEAAANLSIIRGKTNRKP